MQINRTGIGLIAFFGLLGLAMCVVPGAARRRRRSVADRRLDRRDLGPRRRSASSGTRATPEAKAAHQDWIFQNGIKGRATILEVGSHATVNEMPVMKLKLDLDIPGVGRSEVSRREVMPVFTAHRMEAGLVLPAYANPQDPADFVLVW